MQQKENNHILKNMFLKLLPQQMALNIILTLNTIIDSFFTSRFLGSDAMAALGLFTPIINILYLCYVLISGTQIMCGNSIGRGQSKNTVSIFSTSAITLTIFAAISSLVMFTCSAPIASIIGATGVCREMLIDYLRGMSIGIVGLMLYALFVSFLQINNSSDLAKISLAVMISTNFILDILFMYVLNMGMFGLGLASSIASLCSMFTALFGVINSSRKPVVHFQFGVFSAAKIPEMARLGSTQLIFNLAIAFRSFCLNYLLLRIGGTDAVAVMTVLNVFTSFIGSIAAGSSDAVVTIGSILSGEKNHKELEKLFSYSLKVSSIMSIITISFIILFSSKLAFIFYTPAQPAYAMTITMLRIFIWFILFACVNQITAKVRQCQGNIFLSSMLSIAGNIMTVAIAFLLSSAIGVNGIWAALPLGEFCSLILIIAYIIITQHHFPVLSRDWVGYNLKDSASDENSTSFSVKTMDDVINVSRTLMDFCNKVGLNSRSSYLSALAAEEMAGNIIKHGALSNQNFSVDIYALKDKDHLVLRIRDDCKAFDPVQYLAQYDTHEDSFRNIGIKLVAKTAKSMNYQRLLGLNYLMITI